MKKLVSIIVPIYGVEVYLSNCIEKLISQTYKNIEIILVDDGSKDKCPQICDFYEKKDNRVKVIHKKNGGLSSARNAGIAIANGEYVYFVDPDDNLDVTLIEELQKNMSQTNFAICNHFVNFNNKVIKKSSIESQYIKKYDLYEMLNSKQYFCGYVWNKMYNLKLIKKYNLMFEENLSMLEDLVFNSKYVTLSEIEGAYYTNKPLYTYYIRDGSIINTINFNNPKVLKNKLTVFDCLNIIMDIYKKESPCNLYKIKERYIKTVYKYKYLFKKSHGDLKKLNQYIIIAKSYYKEIKGKLTLEEKVKLKFNMCFPVLYGYLGMKKRVE